MFSPCGCCCAETASDTFIRSASSDVNVGSAVGWSEIAQNWSIASGIFGNGLSISSTNAILLATTELADLDSFTIEIKVDRGVVSGDKYRILLDYVDTSNYLAIEFTAGSWIKFIDRVAGLETVTWQNLGEFGIGVAQIAVWRQAPYIWAMYQDTSFSAPRVVVAHVRSLTSGKVAIATGGSLTAGAKIFTDFKMWKGLCKRFDRCDSCGAAVSDVDVGYLPNEINATLTGALNGACTDISALNTNFVVKFAGASDSIRCGWKYFFPSTVCGNNAYLELTADHAGAVRSWKMRLVYNVNDYIVWRGSRTDCGASSPVTLTYESVTGFVGGTFSGSSWSIVE